MQLSIITVSWNVRELVSRLLDSIFQFTDELEYEVIVVDNDSKDDTVKFLTENYAAWIESKKLIVIDNKFNAGFSKANNQGLKIAQGKYVLFMNPDMELLENSFKKLFDFMEQTPNVGISTCRLLYGDKTVQPNVKSDPDLCSQILILLKLHHFLAWLPCLKKYLRKDFDYSQKQYVEQVMGAFIFTKKELMDNINGWNEDYWLWWEDLELCKTVREAGFEIVYLPITEVIHYEGKSFSQTHGLIKQKRFNSGMLTYFKKHHTKFAYILLLGLQPISSLLTILTQLAGIKPRTQSKT
jgi:GT2 family glycosyltransferase